MNRLAQVAATVGGIGYLRPAPGTWGSLAALPLAWAFHTLGSFPMMVIATVATCLAGFWATKVMTKSTQDHDPSEIVIDEVTGQFIALLPLSYATWAYGVEVLAMWPGWLSAFALFRLFDISKPSLVGRADRRGDAVGVMLDDVIAGIFAAIGVLILAAVWHGALGL